MKTLNIILTESQIKNIVKSEVDEALGVPDNMLKESRKVLTYVYDMLSNIVYDGTFISLTQPRGHQEALGLTINIGGKRFDNIVVLIKFNPIDKINTIQLESGAYAPEFSYLDKTGDIARGGRQVLLYRFQIPKKYGKIEDTDVFQNKVMSDLNSDKIRNLMSRTTAHELKHMFDKAIGHDKQVKGVLQYVGFNKSIFKKGMHDSVSHLLFAAYYTHIVETLVRGVEVLQSAESNNVTKKDFASFLKSYTQYDQLVHFKNMSYDKFIKALQQNNIESYKLFSSDNDFDEQKAMQGILETIKETQQSTLESLISVTKKKLERMFPKFNRDRIDKLFNDSYGDIVNKINLEMKLNNPNQNPRLFIQKLIKNIVFNADKGIRNIARVYALLPD